MVPVVLQAVVLRQSCLLATTLLAANLLLSHSSPFLLAVDPEVTARKKVSEGIELYSAGKFGDAAQAFGQAVEGSAASNAEALVILFDQACALRAAGEIDKARELFLQVAMGDNKKLASDSHYNLAAMAADDGRQALGENPLTVDPEQRAKVLERLRAAVSHYRDSLGRDPENADSRHNMELVRLFIKQLEDGWREHDRQQLREKMDLFQFLQFLDQQQSQLRERTGELESRGSKQVSRLERSRLAESQSEQLDEIALLQTKIDTVLKPESTGVGDPNDPNVDPSQPALPSAEEQATIQQLKQMLGEITGRAALSMATAVDSIKAGKMADAMKEQQSVCDRFYETYMVLSPFQQTLQRAINDQQLLIDGRPKMDFQAAAWRQDWISKLSGSLSAKATAMLEGMSNEASEEDVLAAMRPALDKAIELSPAIVEHSNLANQGLLQQQLDLADQEQQEVLRLLKEIADLLPKQPPQDQQQEDQQQDKNQKQQDQSQDSKDKQQSDSSSKDKQQSNADKPSDQSSKPDNQSQSSEKNSRPDEKDKQQAQSENNKQQGEKDQQAQEKEKAQADESKSDYATASESSRSESQSDNKATQQNDQKQKVAEERAQVILRRIREREAKYRELLEQLRQIQGQRSPVEKDW